MRTESEGGKSSQGVVSYSSELSALLLYNQLGFSNLVSRRLFPILRSALSFIERDPELSDAGHHLRLSKETPIIFSRMEYSIAQDVIALAVYVTGSLNFRSPGEWRNSSTVCFIYHPTGIRRVVP